MIRFESDYTEGCAPEILTRLVETNFEQTPGYSTDAYCESAREKIRSACGAPDADVHFLVGGTQANLTLIAAALRPHQGVIAVPTGHINVHETGAIENTGHKVLALPSENSRVNAGTVRSYCRAHYADSSFEHIVQPGMIYISHPTECGELYTLAELRALREVCDEYGLLLYADGARLGYALAAEENDITLHDLYALTDAFYIGGTKVGTLFGEAMVLRNPALKKDFRYLIKQHGGMFAKGRLLGIQFDVLFTDGLYERLGANGIRQALRIKEAFRNAGCSFFIDSVTNQQFPILPDDKLQKLQERFAFTFWEKVGEDRSAVRVCTGWATRTEDVDALLEAIRQVF